MPVSKIQIPTSDGHSLAGTLYTPSLAPPPYGTPHRLPALILAPTFTATQSMGLQNWAQHFTNHLWMAVITFDARGFGESKSPAFTPLEALPAAQVSDIQDALTYASTHPLIDASKLALWGSGLSGGHVLHVAAVDKRVRAVISQAPLVNGWETVSRRVRYDMMPELEARFAADRVARCRAAMGPNPEFPPKLDTATDGGAHIASGAEVKPEFVPVVTDPAAHKGGEAELCALPGRDSWAQFSRFAGGGYGWENAVTLRSLEAMRGYMPATLVDRISPTPLLMVVARDDRVCGTDLALEAFERALPPKEVRIVDGGHYGVYKGEEFEGNVEGQIAWLRGALNL